MTWRKPHYLSMPLLVSAARPSIAVLPRNQSPATAVVHNGASLSESDDDFWHRHFTLDRSEHRNVWCRLTERAKAEIFEAALGSLLLKCREGFHGCPAQIESRRIEASTYLADGRPEEPPGISPSPFDGVSDCKLSRCTQVRLSIAPGGTIPGPYSVSTRRVTTKR